MSQQVYTTVSRVERSPASAAAIASSIKREPVGGVALAHPDQPELGQRDELQVDVTGRPGQLDRSVSSRPRRGRAIR